MVQIEKTDQFVSWLVKLRDAKGAAIVARRIQMLAQGNFGDCAPVGDGVHELKIKFGPGYRVYFWNKGHRLILLLAGGDKSSQGKDIKRAKMMVLSLTSKI